MARARQMRIGNTLNLTFPGVLGESMLIALDLEGVEVSMGSACAAGAVEPSHVLLAMGLRAARSAQLAEAQSRMEHDARPRSSARRKSSLCVWRRVRAAEPLNAVVSTRTAAVAEASR